MEQYPIPQFIESEGKIAFFISFRQFFYLVGAGLLCFFIYFFHLPKPVFILLSLVIFVSGIVLAFGTVNGAPILDVILGSIGFSMGSKNYTWSKKESPYPFKPISRTQIKKIEQGPVLQAQTSQLKKTKTLIDLRTK